MVLQLFIDSVDLSAITAKSNPERPAKIVFLCGGTGEGSIRFHLDKYLREQKLPVFRAEEVIDWRNSSVFQGDLLELEKYIAALSGVIVLISESAGSIAELGSFVNDKEIRKKLLVIIESQYRKKPSFISDGLLANLSQEICEDEPTEQNTQHLYVIEDVPEDPITRKKDFSGYEQNFLGIKDAILNFKVSGGQISLLDPYYQALFVLDLITLSLVISKKELFLVLTEIKKKLDKGGQDRAELFSKKSIERILLLLEKLALVRKEEKGRDIYFIARLNATFLKYKYESEKKDVNTTVIRERNHKEVQQSSLKDKLWQAHGTKIFVPTLSDPQLIRKAPFLYKVFYIPKKNGGTREIAQPTAALKNLQKEKLKEFMTDFPVHQSAVAYRPGMNGIVHNAILHKDNNYFLKLDFHDFFHSIYASDFNYLLERKNIDLDKRAEYLSIFFMFDKKHKKNLKLIQTFENESTGNHLLLKKLTSGVYKSRFRLSIGAPSSPMLSNIFMYDFDEYVADWASEHNIVYSRYADDLTFSSKKRENLASVVNVVNMALKKFTQYAHISLNGEKTKKLSLSNRVTITGINITPEHKISIGREQKKKMRAMLFALENDQFDSTQTSYLKGWLAYLAEVEPQFAKNIRKHFSKAMELLSRR